MRVLVACEFSGVVRRAFRERGHDAWSCDLLRAEDGSEYHMRRDVREILGDDWDLLIAHPPCTRLCNSGVRWLSEPPKKISRAHYTADEVKAYAWMKRDHRLEFMWRKLDVGAEFFSALWNAPIARVCVENPVMHKYAKTLIEGYEPPAQSFQPWQFGHGEVKRTCLWLRGLPPLVPTQIVAGREARVHRMSPGKNRWKERSRTYEGVARAMAEQWG